MPSKKVDEEVREIIRLLSSDDKKKILEFVDEENDLAGMVDRLENRGMTFVRQTFLDFEDLGLVEKNGEDYSTAKRTIDGDEVLKIRETFNEDYRQAVERFFQNNYSMEEADHIHDIVDFNDGELEAKVPGLPEEFLRMQDMFDLFYELEPDQRLDDLSDRFDITEPSVRKRIRSLESQGLVNEKKQGRHEKAFFYGPFAFPFLKMASRIDQIYEEESYEEQGVDWSWIPEREETREPDFVDYKNLDSRRDSLPQRADTQNTSVNEGRQYFEAYDGVAEKEIIEEIEKIEDLEGLNESLSTADMAVREVSAINPGNLVLKGGYIWNDYTDEDIEKGDYLLISETGGKNTGFDEVEALGRLDGGSEEIPF